MDTRLIGIALITLLLGACSSDLDKVRGQFIDSCMSGGEVGKSECKPQRCLRTPALMW